MFVCVRGWGDDGGEMSRFVTRIYKPQPQSCKCNCSPFSPPGGTRKALLGDDATVRVAKWRRLGDGE